VPAASLCWCASGSRLAVPIRCPLSGESQHENKKEPTRSPLCGERSETPCCGIGHQLASLCAQLMILLPLGMLFGPLVLPLQLALWPHVPTRRATLRTCLTRGATIWHTRNHLAHAQSSGTRAIIWHTRNHLAHAQSSGTRATTRHTRDHLAVPSRRRRISHLSLSLLYATEICCSAACTDLPSSLRLHATPTPPLDHFA